MLVVEDAQSDLEQSMRQLRRGGFAPAWRRVESLREFKAALGSAVWDVVLSDYQLPQIGALEALDLLRASDHDTPFIVVTERLDEETAVACLKRGADNYVLKSNLSALPAVVRRELREAEARREHRRATDALRRSEERFRQLTESIREVFWITDRHKTEVVYVSPAYEQVFGRTCQSLYEEPGSFEEAVHPNDRARMATFIELQKQGRFGRLEHRIIRPDGSIRWIRSRAFPVRNERGEVYRIAGVSEDITSRRRAEQALGASEKRYRTLVEHTGVGIWHFSKDGHTIYANPAMCRMLQVAGADELRRGTCDAFFEPQSLEVVRDLIAGRGPAAPEQEIEVQIQGKHGGQRPAMMSGAPLRSSDGVVQSLLASFVDITERKSAEEEKARLEADLAHAQKMEAVGTLAAGIAHNFNNLLTAIFGCVKLAKDQLPGHPALAQVLMIEQAAQQAGEVTRSLLTFAHKTASSKTAVDLGRLITDSMALLRHVLPSSIQIVEDVAPDRPLWVLCDAAQVQQVLMNLAVNARDSMPTGGRIWISLHRDGDGDDDGGGDGESDGVVEQSDGATGRGDHVGAPGNAVLTVRDSGAGMGAQTRARIFEPFFTTKPRGQGTGLGLAAVHGIVTDHRGWVDVSSKRSQGTTMRITLPCCPPPKGAGVQEPDAAPASQEVAAPAPGRGECIILAEQHDYVRSIMASTLEAAGYDVAQAADGDEAMALFDQRRADVRVVILGLSLAGTPTASCARSIRLARPDLPIVVVTGSAEPNPLDEDDGAVQMLRKPFQMSDLTALVSQCLAHPPADGVGANR